MRRLLALGLMLAMAEPAFAEPKDEPFRWGAASAAYQVEGATTADAKGP